MDGKTRAEKTVVYPESPVRPALWGDPKMRESRQGLKHRKQCRPGPGDAAAVAVGGRCDPEYGT